jgi:GT2 family glycosyltransferase
MKIGIGVCSYNRPELATQVCKDILSTVDTSKYEIKTICSVDDTNLTGYDWVKDNFGLIYGPNGGIPINKNRIIKYLSDCDVMFLSEDDITFKKEGWIDSYLKALRVTKYHHFNFIVSDYRKYIKQALQYPEDVQLGITGNYVNGVLMVMTKHCIDTIGGFDLRYKKYGYEHADYTRRCAIAGLYPNRFHVHVMDATNYIDWVHSESCISNDEKTKCIEYNAKLFHAPINTVFQPYDTTQYLIK